MDGGEGIQIKAAGLASVAVCVCARVPDAEEPGGGEPDLGQIKCVSAGDFWICGVDAVVGGGQGGLCAGASGEAAVTIVRVAGPLVPLQAIA